jgi:hypothetical protein
MVTLLRLFSRVPGLGGCAPVHAWQLDAKAAAPGLESTPVITRSAAAAVQYRLVSHRVRIWWCSSLATAECRVLRIRG